MRRFSPLFRFLEIGASMIFFSCRLLGRWLASKILRRKISSRTLLGEELRLLCERLGATFIKLGQVLSSRPDLLSPDLTAPLARLQDDVTPFSNAGSFVERAFERSLDDLFAHFEPEPLASASIAQVHKAKLHDGREVAVKIRRPGIVQQVDDDFRMMHFIARMIGSLPPMRLVPMGELIAELEIPIRQQLDFYREVASLERFRNHFDQVEHITLPVPVPELCSAAVLTMELLTDLEKVTSPRFSEAERKTAALAGLRALYKMIFVDGFIHADMHPGNVFMRQWGEIVILDMGLVAELTDSDLQNFVDFFFGLVNNEGEICARIVYDTALYIAPRCDREEFEAAIIEMVSRHSALKSHEFEVTHFVYELIETQRKHGIRGSTQFIMTVLSMVVYDGICKLLYPDCEFQKEARGYLIAAKYRRHQRMAIAV